MDRYSHKMRYWTTVIAPVSEPVGGSLYASEPAVAPVAPATSVASTSSPNRWLFSGKESQSILNASIPLLDFGVRMYNPAIARWTAADPLSEKYYGISPYGYCAITTVVGFIRLLTSDFCVVRVCHS